MSQRKNIEKSLWKKTSSQILVPSKAGDSSPQISSALKCTKSESTLMKSVASKLFSWNREKPRRTSEYVEKKYKEPFNKVAPELRVIGGLGHIRCVSKHERQPLVNRPSQVQKVCHTTTKFLPSFSLTEQLRPTTCPKKKKISLVEAVETVKLAKNLRRLPPTLIEQENTKDSFNHKNPFNLDLNALSEYQQHKHNNEEKEKRRNDQIIRRTMETKALRSEGVERMKQEMRDEKFQLPAFFKVLEKNKIAKTASATEIGSSGCKYVSMMKKKENQEIAQLHYKHKEEKLRKRLLVEAEENENLAKETEKLEKENEENFVFRLAEVPSAMKIAYKEIIANKLQEHNAAVKSTDASFDAANKDDSKVVNGNIDKEEQSSVETSSSLSSAGTYFSNDSGSFVIAMDKTIPRSQMKKQKMFQNRSLVTTKKELSYDELAYFIPDICQYNFVKEMCKPKDKFHTYRTRSCANIRERIKVELPAYEDELIGTDKFKSVSKLATDIDDYYQAELYHERSRTQYRFQPRTEITKLRETLREKMDIYWIKERMVLDEVNEINRQVLMEKIESQALEFSKFLDDYKDESLNQTTKKTKQLKGCYEQTDRLRETLVELKVKLEPLQTSISVLGGEFIRLMTLKKFQYLLKPTEWRLKHDFIHRTPNKDLENPQDSINNRAIANLWNRNNATVNSIIDFIENVYLKNEHRMIRAFEDGEGLIRATQELQAKSCRSLLQFHLAAHASCDAEQEFIVLEDRKNSLINHWTHLVKVLSKKRVFMESRMKLMEQAALKVTDKPLEESVSAKQLHYLRGICRLAFQDIVLKNGDPSLAKSYSSTEKIAEVEKKVFDILSKLDKIPRDKIDEIEMQIRKERKKKMLQAERAYKIELGIQNRIVQLQRCLQKPPKKEKHLGRLPMSVLPKKPSKIKIPKPLLTPIEEEYIRAFTELGENKAVKFDENAKRMIDRIKNESTPFYVDHLLDTLGYKLPKLSEVEAEKIFLDEAKNFKFKDVLPSVRNKVKMWEDQSEAVKQANIRKTPYLYE